MSLCDYLLLINISTAGILAGIALALGYKWYGKQSGN